MIKNNPLLSIIVPVYGTEKYLDRCIKSVINQSYKTLEIISENLKKICDKFGEK